MRLRHLHWPLLLVLMLVPWFAPRGEGPDLEAEIAAGEDDLLLEDRGLDAPEEEAALGPLLPEDLAVRPAGPEEPPRTPRGPSAAELIPVDPPKPPPPPTAKGLQPLMLREIDGTLELVTPFGPFRVVGDTKGDFRISVPLESLKPKPKDPEPAADPPRNMASKPPLAPAPEGIPGLPPPVVSMHDDTDRLVVEANHHWNRRRYFEAFTVVERLLRLRPDYVRGWLMKGSLLHIQGHRELALKAWQTAKQLDPNNPEIDSILERYK